MSGLAVGLTICLSVCGATVAAGVAVFLLQHRLIFFPSRLDESMAYLEGYAHFEIAMKHRGVQLHGWLLNPGRSGLILYYGGNAEEVSGNLDRFARLEGWSVLLMNYRGYGRSHGRPGQRALFGDALFAYDTLRDRGLMPSGQVVVFGRSLGTAVALYVAGHRPVLGAVLVTPFDSVRELGQRLYPFLPVRWFVLHPFDAIQYARKVSVPSLCLMAEQDEIIPHEHTLRLVHALGPSCRSALIQSAGHNDIHTFGRAWLEIMHFLDRVGGEAHSEEAIASDAYL